MVTTHNVSFAYPGGQPMNFPDISCQPGQLLLVIGKSGVGKTTFLHLLGGLISSKEGMITIGDQVIQKLSGRNMDKFRGKNIGVIFQNNHFVQSLTVVENLLLAQSLAGVKPQKSECLHWLKKLSIEHKSNAAMHQLSQGERQRVAIARALVNKPKLILADEPTSALDDENTLKVIRLLEEQAKEAGSALVIVTHDNRLKEVISHQITLS